MSRKLVLPEMKLNQEDRENLERILNNERPRFILAEVDMYQYDSDLKIQMHGVNNKMVVETIKQLIRAVAGNSEVKPSVVLAGLAVELFTEEND